MAKWSKGRRLINAYGPTENTVCTTMHRYSKGTSHTNIGKPLNNVKVYILDRHLNPVPIGVVGELYIGGAGLSRGYLNNPELTAERFIPNLFATKIDIKYGYTRIYKTGDLAKWLSDGYLEYIGRNDFQVKIRGFRIELGEIEHALSKHPSTKQAAVLVKECVNEAGESHKYLVAYYVVNDNISEDALIEYVNQILPNYMVPTIFVKMKSFPLNINGKLDRNSLPEPKLDTSKNNYVPPSTMLEHEMCQIWQEVLNIKKIGIKDNFFRIGGDSILAVQLAHRIGRSLKTDFPVTNIFSLKTIDMICHNLNQGQNKWFSGELQ